MISLKNYKWVLLVVGLFVTSSLFVVDFIYKKKVPISKKEAIFSGDISDFIKANIQENSVVILKDSVTAVSGNELKLGNEISVQYLESESQSFSNVKKGDFVFLKGIYLGYNDLLEEYQLINCILLDDE